MHRVASVAHTNALRGVRLAIQLNNSGRAEQSAIIGRVQAGLDRQSALRCLPTG